MNQEGVSEAVQLAEEVCVGICLMLPREDLLATGLQPEDFFFKTCQDIWREALRMETPCPTVLMDRDPQLCVDMERARSRRDISDFNVGTLMANAGLVKRDSVRRKRLRELGKEVAAVGRGSRTRWWSKYQEEE